MQKMPTEDTLRLTVAALMQATGETKTDLATGIGLTQPKVSRRQNGQTTWTLTDCDALANHYNITILQLLAGPAEACNALPPQRRRTPTNRKQKPSAPQPDPTPTPTQPQPAPPTTPQPENQPCVLCGKPAHDQVEGFWQHLDPTECQPTPPTPPTNTTPPKPHHTPTHRTPENLTEAIDRITQTVETTLKEHAGDTEAATTHLEYRAIRDVMDLLDVCRKNGRFEFSIFPPMPDILKKKTARAPDQIWEGWMNWKNEQLPPGEHQVDVLDVNGAYLAALKSHLPIGALQHRTGPEPDPALARRQSGVHLVTPPAWAHTDLPNPIGQRDELGDLWITESTLRLLQRISTEKYGRLCEAPVVHESWYSAGSESLLDKLRRVLTAKRQEAIETGDEVTEKYVKAMYAKLISTLGESSSNFSIKRADWRHIIRSQAAANLWSKAYKAHMAGLTVVQVSGTDEIHLMGEWRGVFKEGRGLAEIKMARSYSVSEGGA